MYTVIAVIPLLREVLRNSITLLQLPATGSDSSPGPLHLSQCEDGDCECGYDSKAAGGSETGKGAYYLTNEVVLSNHI